MNRVVTWSMCLLLPLAAACRGDEPRAPSAGTTPATSRIEAPLVGIYVTNETSGDLSVIDAATNTVVGTIPLGKRPRGIAISPDGGTIYVALSRVPTGTAWRR